jgi:hypothetical protein
LFDQVVGNGYETPLGNVETPEKVVRVALRALEQGRPSVISGRQNALSANLSRFVPRGLVVRMMVRITKQRYEPRQSNIRLLCALWRESLLLSRWMHRNNFARIRRVLQEARSERAILGYMSASGNAIAVEGVDRPLSPLADR